MDHILSESSQHLDCPFLIGRALIVTGVNSVDVID